MDLTPDKNYHPEDEYESLEPTLSPDKDTAEHDSQPLPKEAAQEKAVPSAPEPEQVTQPEAKQEPDPVSAAAVAPAPVAPAPQPAVRSPQPAPAIPVQNTMHTAPGAPAPYYPYPQPYYYVPQQPVQPMPPVQPQVGQPMPQPQQPWQPIGYPYPQPAPMPVAPPQPPVTAAPPVAPAPNPYASNTAPQPAPVTPQKQRASAGTKVFIIVLCALLAAMIIGFGIYIATAPKSEKKNSDRQDTNFSIGNGELDEYFNNNSGNFTEKEYSIKLTEDNGETQKRDDDNKASVGTPDEAAKSIKQQPLPSDKDSSKYTAQSAYDSVSASVVTVCCYEKEITENKTDIISQGTGTIISTDGYLITNAHVIGNSRAFLIKVVFSNGDTYQATIIGFDTWSDLAVLKIDAKDLKAVTFGDSSKISIGEDVYAVGSPGGEQFKNTLTSGVVSAVDREISVNKYVRYIQSDAAISPGNSGGPLCNRYGQVIGITTAKTIAENYENISFSIPSATVESIVNDLMHYGYVKGRARLGFSGRQVTAEAASYYGIPSGVIIESIDKNGSFADTDIKVADIVTELDGESISSFQDIYNVLAKHEAGDEITVKVKHPED